jgi:hypothetical protein
MRLLITVTLPATAEDGATREVIAAFLETWRPESAYFGTDGADRAVFLVVDVEDLEQLPGMFEPLCALDARIVFKPVFSTDELFTRSYPIHS